MVHEHTTGRIVEIRETGEAVIMTVLPNLNHALDRQYDSVEIILPDGRSITAKQRAKIYGLISDIALYVAGKADSQTIEEIKSIMKWEFCLQRMESQERRLFSLSDVDETTAAAFIAYLIDFIVENNIPTKVPLLTQCEDIGRYLYACLLARKCCVCGKSHAHVHHCLGSRIGAGNDRESVHHLGRAVLPLCDAHHMEVHQDEIKFMSKYHLQAIKLDEKLCKKLNLNI